MPTGCLTRSDLVTLLAARGQIPTGKADLIVDVIFESMETSLKNGGRIEIRGLGTFTVRWHKNGGRHPRTGEPVAVKPKRRPFFKAAKELRERVDKKKDQSSSTTRAARRP